MTGPAHAHVAAPRRGALVTIYVLYVFSGMAAIGVEIVWSRMLGRVLGSQSTAVTFVLAAFLAGMGAGALSIQGIVGRIRDPLALFAALEFAAAAATISLTFFLDAGSEILRGPAGEPIALGLLSVAAAPLGAGFPVLLVALSPTRRDRRVRVLYGLNAIGGAAGGVLVGLLGVPLVGERGIASALAGVQVGVAMGASFLARAAGSKGRGAADPDPACSSSPLLATERDAEPRQGYGEGLRLGLFLLLSGVSVFFWEVLWTRILVLTVGSSVYAFSLVAASVVLGIGVGSLVWGGRRLGRHGAWVLPLLALVLGAAAYAAVPRLADAYLLAVRALPLSPLGCGALGAGLVVFLPNFLLGSLFPWIVSHRPRLAGALFAVNSAGCIAGAFLAGPLTAGLWRLEAAYRMGLALLLVLTAAGAWVAAAGATRRRARLLVSAVASCAVLGAFAMATAGALLVGEGENPPGGGSGLWDYKRLLSGVYQWSPESLRTQELDDTYARRDLLAVVEGREVIVSVELDRLANTVYVCGNGKPEGSVPWRYGQPSNADLPTQVLLGAVPVVLLEEGSAAPKLIVGLGSGVTLGALLSAGDVCRQRGPVHVAEIEPAYVEALRAPGVSGTIRPFLDLARREGDVRWHFGDARRLLSGPLSSERFGAIVSQPSEPWIAASAPLFTVEFFREAARLLTEDGVFVQWIQIVRLDRESLRLVVRTFRSVFPRTVILRPPGTGELLLVGFRGPLALDRLARVPELPHVAATGITGPAGWLATYLLGPRGVERWAKASADRSLNTDRRGDLEYRAARGLALESDDARRTLEDMRAVGAEEPVTLYVSDEWARPEARRLLARANVRIGDLEEAEALIASDGSREAQALLEEIAALRRDRAAPEGRDEG